MNAPLRGPAKLRRAHALIALPAFADRFWAKVDKSVDPGDCWLWRGARSSSGYGVIELSTDGQWWAFGAHRASWILAGNGIPWGLCILHRCDVRACVNPSHLFIGTLGDNNRDAVAKGRNRSGAALRPERLPRGESHPNARMTEGSVAALRALAGTASQRALAARFGISPSTVAQILSGETWREVGR